MMTIPSSAGTARQHYSSAMMGRPHAVVTDLDSFMHRGSETPVAARPSAMALLGTTDGTTDGTTPLSHAIHGDFKLGFREQPIVFDHEAALTRPGSALTAGGSALSAHDSGLTGIALDKGYMGRQGPSGGTEPELMDESQCDVDAVRSLLLSRKVMSQSETASAPSRIVESGGETCSCCHPLLTSGILCGVLLMLPQRLGRHQTTFIVHLHCVYLLTLAWSLVKTCQLLAEDTCMLTPSDLCFSLSQHCRDIVHADPLQCMVQYRYACSTPISIQSIAVCWVADSS